MSDRCNCPRYHVMDPGDFAWDCPIHGDKFLQKIIRDAEEKKQDELKRLRAFVKDLADRGLRCDLTPTMRLESPGQIYMDFANYLNREDSSLRDRAREALDGSTTPRKE